jgi:hypothetical protein
VRTDGLGYERGALNVRVYRVHVDVDQFQSFYLAEGESLRDFEFDGTRRTAWNSPEVFVLYPKLRKGNFFGFPDCVGSWIIDTTVHRKLGWLLEGPAQLLPFLHQGEEFYFVNVTECINALDEKKTEWVYGKTTGEPIRIKGYVFHPSRFSEFALFKIPETCRAEILCTDGLRDPEDEFIHNVKRHGLTGLAFEELWSDGR